MKLLIQRLVHSMFVMSLFNCQIGVGQSIKGDTIYVNEEAEIGIRFPSRPSSFYTTPSNAPYNLASLPPTGFTISAKADKTPNALLFVTEGNNSHQFIISFKKNIDYNNAAEMVFDYSTKAKLEERVRFLAARQDAKSKKPVIEESRPTDGGPQVKTGEVKTSKTGSSVSIDSSEVLYNKAMETGKRNMDLELYALAKLNFERALGLKPNEKLPLQLLDEVNKKLGNTGADAAKTNEYNRFISEGLAGLNLKDYPRAKGAFKNALKAKPGDLYAQKQIENIDKISSSQKDVQEGQRLKELYNGYMQEGEKALAKNQLAEARIAFEQALTIRPNDNAATGKMKIIRDKEKKEMQVQNSEQNYMLIVDSADKLYLQRDYANAKLGYSKALSIFKRPWPQEQINNIDKIFADEKKAKMTAANTQQAEQAEVARKESISKQYNGIIQKADIEFDKGNYTKARQLYGEASRLKPTEQHPIDRIEIIQTALDLIAKTEKAKADSLAAVAESKKKFNLAASRGKSYYQKGDLENARLAYEEALSLKPDDTESMKQLEKINNKLAEIETARVLNERYNALINAADSLLILKDYEDALGLFKEAAALKPAETYPGRQVAYIQKELINKASSDAASRERERQARYRKAAQNADQAVKDKRFFDAIAGYNEALSIKPNNEPLKKGLSIATYQYDQQKTKYDQEQQQLNRSTRHLVVQPKKKRKRDKTPVVQKTLVPYTLDELNTKYPAFNFASFPSKQPFNKDAVHMTAVQGGAQNVFLGKPRLDLPVTDQSVKLTCQGIFFSDKMTTLRFLVENNGSTDFLTGPMMLTWSKAIGTRVKLFPIYIYPSFLPVVKPGEEALIVYVCKAYEVEDADKLEFELNDRLEKMKLTLNLPATVYKAEAKK